MTYADNESHDLRAERDRLMIDLTAAEVSNAKHAEALDEMRRAQGKLLDRVDRMRAERDALAAAVRGLTAERDALARRLAMCADQAGADSCAAEIVRLTAEVAHLQSTYCPNHTDLMVTPEAIDAHLDGGGEEEHRGMMIVLGTGRLGIAYCEFPDGVYGVDISLLDKAIPIGEPAGGVAGDPTDMSKTILQIRVEHPASALVLIEELQKAMDAALAGGGEKWSGIEQAARRMVADGPAEEPESEEVDGEN